MVNTRFWNDGYIMNLDPSEKLVFLYLITNSRTETCGGYEFPIRLAALETGLESEMVSKILRRFENDRKIVLCDGWVWISNFTKHQAWNPSMKEGADKTFAQLPLKLREKIQGLAECTQDDPILTPSCTQDVQKLYLTKLNLTKPNLESGVKKLSQEGGDGGLSTAHTPKDEAMQFFSSEEDQAAALRWLVERGISEDAGLREIKKFVSYWTEPTLSGKKERWQTEKTFDVKRRLATWLSRVKDFTQPSRMAIID